MIYRLAQPEDGKYFPFIQYEAITRLSDNFYKPEIVKIWRPDITKNPSSLYKNEAAFINNPDVLTIVAEENNRIVCFGSLIISKMYLWRLYISPDWSHKGIATHLLQEIEKEAKKLNITEIKLDSSLNAEKFYKKQGYTSITRWEKPMKNNQSISCIRMEKVL